MAGKEVWRTEPHETHTMGDAESTIIGERFGSRRSCIACGAEQAETVAGQTVDPLLTRPCTETEAGQRAIDAACAARKEKAVQTVMDALEIDSAALPREQAELIVEALYEAKLL